MMTDTVDVLIAGAGPAGAAAALALTRYTGLSVLVIDRRSEPGLALGELVTPGVLPLLAFVGVAGALSEDGHLPAQGVAAAWTHAAPVPRDFFFSAQGQGWHLDRRRFNRRLAGEAEAAGASLRFDTRVTGVRSDGDPARPWRLTLRSGTGTGGFEVGARFLIDAGGRAAGLARRLGARRLPGDRLIGVAGFCPPIMDAPIAGMAAEADPWPATTLIEAAAEGWWYSAPLPGGRLVATLLSDADIVRAHQLHRPAPWRTALERAPLTARRFARHRGAGPPIVRAAQSQVLAPPSGPGWIAAGDAAAAFDPFSGMGIGHALSSGLHAARAAEAALAGDDTLKEQYANGVASNYALYRRSLSATYAAVDRFPDAPFWRRRHPPSLSA